MKRFLLFALSIVALCGFARADRGAAVDFGQLPQKAQTFITDNFSKADISSVTQERPLLALGAGGLWRCCPDTWREKNG